MSDHLLSFPWLDLVLILALITLNGVLSMSELAIVSSREARLKAMVKSGSAGAKCALTLAAEPGRFLSTVQTWITLQFTDAAGASIPNIGASGAIAGVLGAYFVLLPRASVLTAFIFFFIFLREIPAIYFLGIWFLFQLLEGSFSVLQPQAGGGVAFFAHVGGFAFGLATVRLVSSRGPLRPAW